MKPVPPARTMRPVMPGFPRIPQDSLVFPAVDKRRLKQLFLVSEFYLLHKIDLVIMKMEITCGGCRVCARQAPRDPYGLSRKQEHNHKKSSHSIE